MLIAISLEFWRQKKSRKTFILRDLVFLFCGETGIRTPGTSQFNGFQDRRNRPLCHLSGSLIRRQM